MAAFHVAGERRDGHSPLLSTDQPCMVISRIGHLFASDPTRHGVRAHLPVSGGTTVRMTLPADGTSVEAR